MSSRNVSSRRRRDAPAPAPAGRRRRGARIELAAPAGDLRRRLLRIEARPFGRSIGMPLDLSFNLPRRLARPFRFGFDAPRQSVEPRIEIAGSGFERALDALLDRRQPFGRGLYRLGALGPAFETGNRLFKQIVVARGSR